ncbi:MAG: PAS domain S-box protein [Spirochaetia bacterium]|nr:PAS domain S-box protein [Spirochaetia bacterium]
MVLSIIQNISIIIAAEVLYHFLSKSFSGKAYLISILNGILFGLTAVLAMMTPFRFESGIIYDGRTIVIGIATLFGGPLTGSMASAIAASYRIFIVGGSGYLAGVLSILEAFVIGAIFNRIRKHSKPSQELLLVIASALLIHIFMLLAQLFLPNERWRLVLPVIAPVVLTIYPIGFILVSALFIEAEKSARVQEKLQESEERYRKIFNNHHTVMLIIDPQSGAVIDANPAAEAYYGYSREALCSMNITDINTLNPEEVKQGMARAKQFRKNAFQFRHRLASGEIRDVEVFSGPIDFSGKEYLYSIVHDISEKMEAERKIAEINENLEKIVAKRTEALEAANRELESFAYSVSHDLRAPLRAIEGFFGFLMQEIAEINPSLSDNARHYQERIRFNITKMNLLIDDLLNLSRIGTQELSLQSVDMSELAREVANELLSENPGRRAAITIDPAMTCIADKALLKVALTNLFSNALKYTSTVIQPSIRFSSMDKDNERVYFIKDNGIGFDMQYAGKLFTPFQKLHSDKRYPGTGIGLSIVRRVISKHGGKIWAEAVPDKGATFYFTLGG